MRTPLHLLSAASAAFLHAASIGVAAGTVGCIFTQRIEIVVRVALVAFLIGGALFGYGIWRSLRPGRSAFLGRQYSGH